MPTSINTKVNNIMDGMPDFIKVVTIKNTMPTVSEPLSRQASTELDTADGIDYTTDRLLKIAELVITKAEQGDENCLKLVGSQ